MLLVKLLSGLEYRLYGVRGDLDITCPFCDSRAAVTGGLFICIRGTETDGNLYAEEALARGAVCVVTDKEREGIPSVVVSDTRYSAAVVWNNYFGRPAKGMRIFGITGTNGKTSTAAFLSSCLGAEGRRVGSIGTLGAFYNGERIKSAGSEKVGVAAAMTTPDPKYLYGALAKLRDMGAQDVVMEVSSHSVMQRKVDAIPFYMGVFTNLSPEHLDYHGTMEEYFRVKADFVSRCPERIVNSDDLWCRRFAASVPSVAVGRESVRNENVENSGVSYDLELFGRKLFVESSVGGDFSVSNTLLAAAAALRAGASVAAVEKGIRAVQSVPGRLERVARAEEWGFDVFCDYAHTPAALEGVLLHLKRNTEGRLICVFGCGGDRDPKKRPLMGKAAECLCDGVIVTSDNPRGEDRMAIIRDIISGMTGRNSVVIPDRKEAIFAAVSMADRGDTVLLAGKGHEVYEIDRDGMHHFDEREAVNEALRLKYGK